MSFAIIRQQKIKGEEHFNGLAAHNKREYHSKNIVKERSHKNITLSPFIYRNFKEFVASKKKMIFEGNKKNGTKNRMLRSLKNKKTGERELPSMAQEFIFTHSPKALSETKSIEYLRLADKFLREWFDGLEVLGSVIHLDETTPHLHFEVTYFDLGRAKFCQSELQDKGKTDITAIREAWNEYLIGTEFESLKMQDGSVVSAREHESKASLVVAELKKQISDLKSSLERLGDKLGLTRIENKPISDVSPNSDMPKTVEEQIAEARARVKAKTSKRLGSKSPKLKN
jgi:hypothetical protein